MINHNLHLTNELSLTNQLIFQVYHPIKELDLQESDSDICDSDALDSIFNTKCQLLVEKQVVSNESYILHMHGTG